MDMKGKIGRCLHWHDKILGSFLEIWNMAKLLQYKFVLHFAYHQYWKVFREHYSTNHSI